MERAKRKLLGASYRDRLPEPRAHKRIEKVSSSPSGPALTEGPAYTHEASKGYPKPLPAPEPLPAPVDKKPTKYGEERSSFSFFGSLRKSISAKPQSEFESSLQEEAKKESNASYRKAYIEQARQEAKTAAEKRASERAARVFGRPSAVEHAKGAVTGIRKAGSFMGWTQPMSKKPFGGLLAPKMQVGIGLRSLAPRGSTQVSGSYVSIRRAAMLTGRSEQEILSLIRSGKIVHGRNVATGGFLIPLSELSKVGARARQTTGFMPKPAFAFGMGGGMGVSFLPSMPGQPRRVPFRPPVRRVAVRMNPQSGRVEQVIKPVQRPSPFGFNLGLGFRPKVAYPLRRRRR